MMGRRFAFANPTSATISVQIQVHSDYTGAQIIVTDNLRSESRFITGLNESKCDKI